MVDFNKMLLDIQMLRLAQHVSTWSKDPSTKVGAVIVRDGRALALGYNRFPEGHPDTDEFYADRNYKLAHIVHAEVWALNQLPKGAAAGGTVYTSFPCCDACMKALGEAGIVRAVSPPLSAEGRSVEWFKEWRARISRASEVANRYGIEVRAVRV